MDGIDLEKKRNEIYEKIRAKADELVMAHRLSGKEYTLNEYLHLAIMILINSAADIPDQNYKNAVKYICSTIMSAEIYYDTELKKDLNNGILSIQTK